MARYDLKDQHEDAQALEEGDQVLVNDRERALTVTGRHTKPATKSYSPDDHYNIVELAGNGTEYHLLWMDGSVKPMLYKRTAWEPVEGEDYYEYPRTGDRVHSIEVVES